MLTFMMKLSQIKIKDSLAVGIIGGLIGVLCMDISNLILWRAKKTEGLYGHLAGSMIMKPSRLNKGKNFLIGQLFHMMVGSAIGVFMSQLLKKTGRDYHLLKGGFLSVLTWGILYNFGQRMGFYRMNPRLTKSGYAAIWHHLIYGLATSHAIVALADPAIFPHKESGAEKLNNKANEVLRRKDIRTIYSDINFNLPEIESALN